MTLAVPVSMYGAKERDERKERNKARRATLRPKVPRDWPSKTTIHRRSSIERTTVSRLPSLGFTKGVRRPFCWSRGSHALTVEFSWPIPASPRRPFPDVVSAPATGTSPRKSTQRNENRSLSRFSSYRDPGETRGKKGIGPGEVTDETVDRLSVESERSREQCHAMQRYASFHHR